MESYSSKRSRHFQSEVRSTMNLDYNCVLCQEPAEAIRPWDAVWDRKCAHSIYTLLEVDQKDFKLFENVHYCRPCHEFIRDVDFTVRTFAALQEKILDFKAILSQMLPTNSKKDLDPDKDIKAGESSSGGGDPGGSSDIVSILDLKTEEAETWAVNSFCDEEYDDPLLQDDTAGAGVETMDVSLIKQELAEQKDARFDPIEGANSSHSRGSIRISRNKITPDYHVDSESEDDSDIFVDEDDVESSDLGDSDGEEHGIVLNKTPTKNSVRSKRTAESARRESTANTDTSATQETQICGIDGCSYSVESAGWMTVHKVEHQASTKPNPDDPSSTFACPVCKLHFATHTIYESHLERIHRPIVGIPTQLRCPHCPKKFGRTTMRPHTFTLLQKHFQEIHVPREYETDTRKCTWCCPVWDCRIRFRAKKQLQAHLQNEALLDLKIDKFCGVDGCTFTARSEDWMGVHKVEHLASTKPNPRERDSTFRCPVCSLHFATFEIYESHMERVHRPSLGAPSFLQCPHCSKQFVAQGTFGGMTRRSLQNFQKHFQSVHVQADLETDKRRRKYICPVLDCMSRLPSQARLDTHYRKFHEKDPNPFKCDACPKAYTTASYLREHKALHHIGPVLICPVCKEGFALKTKFTSHLKRNHPSAEKFSCIVCKFKYLFEEDCTEHEKLHTPNFYICVLGKCKALRLKRPTKCDSQEDLERHVFEFHTKKYEPLQCPQCPKQFNKKGHLDDHMEARHPDPSKKKIYKCTLCSKTFHFRHGLYQHRNRHKQKSQAASATATSSNPHQQQTTSKPASTPNNKRKRKTRILESASDYSESDPDVNIYPKTKPRKIARRSKL